MESLIERIERMTGKSAEKHAYCPDAVWELSTEQLASLCREYGWLAVGGALVMTQRCCRDPREAALALFERIGDERSFTLATMYLTHCLQQNPEIHAPEDKNASDIPSHD